MKNKNLNKVILVVTGAIILIGALTLFTKQSEAPTSSQLQTNETVTQEERSVTLSIESVYDSITVPVIADDTVLSLLERINKEDQDLRLSTESYEGMGTLVTALGGLENGLDDHYWQYEVNGEMPMVGADNYKLNGGESVVWEFKASEL